MTTPVAFFDFAESGDLGRAYAELLILTGGWRNEAAISDADRQQCRRIGADINRLGGFAAMQEAYYLARKMNWEVTPIQAFWDGVGEWRW